MGRQIIKVDPGLDVYVGWSSITEGPVYFGDRAEVLDLFAAELIEWADRSDMIDGGITAAARAKYRKVAEDALQRADEYGSSSVQLGMTWGAREIFMQRGWLDRDGLRHLVELLINDPAGEQADPGSYDGTGWIQPFDEQAYG